MSCCTCAQRRCSKLLWISQTSHFHRFLRRHTSSPRTVVNDLHPFMTFLRSCAFLRRSSSMPRIALIRCSRAQCHIQELVRIFKPSGAYVYIPIEMYTLINTSANTNSPTQVQIPSFLEHNAVAATLWIAPMNAQRGRGTISNMLAGTLQKLITVQRVADGALRTSARKRSNRRHSLNARPTHAFLRIPTSPPHASASSRCPAPRRATAATSYALFGNLMRRRAERVFT